MSARFFSNGSLPAGAVKVVRLGKRYESKVSWLRRFSAEVGDDELQDDDEPGGGEKEDYVADRAWALKDVTFSMAPGERIAILGAAGAGKSTLIRLLSGVLTPSEGMVEGSGTSILLSAVGTPIAPRRTGYENLFMLSHLLRVPRVQLEANIGKIVEFSELGAHVNKEVRTYSRSMFHRLGLSMALNIDPDILLVDDGVSSRDPKFHGKVMQRLAELCDKGTSLIFAAGHSRRVRALCSRAIVLKSGILTFDGHINEASRHYAQDHLGSTGVEDDEPLATDDQAQREGFELTSQLTAKPEWRGDIAEILDKAGDDRVLADDMTGALKAYTASLALLRKLASAAPTRADHQRSVSQSLTKIGDVRFSSCDRAGALAAYDESLEIRRKLFTIDKDNPDWQTELVTGLRNVARASDNDKRAQACLEEALRMEAPLEQRLDRTAR